MVKEEKKGRGRNPVPIELKRKQFSTMLDPDFYNNFRKWCFENNISQGRAIEIFSHVATDNFAKDLTIVK